ncbi:hypothetical protein GGQ54_003042 [Naumannella cuiyingiana]|uniref:Uncharacterized protein n=1 Tax=Naumannella cuiyingiana TaxID=1347891 RepID=A0A7Z0DBI6_9ACTN|nr:hypothetical protein [Naumannella cuiyingiana]
MIRAAAGISETSIILGPASARRIDAVSRFR